MHNERVYMYIHILDNSRNFDIYVTKFTTKTRTQNDYCTFDSTRRISLKSNTMFTELQI